jgi:RimJ/RimL family protein N-acetyltransferase
MVDVVRTQRLVLRPLAASDADRVHTLFNNWNVIRRLSSPPWPYTFEDARSFVGHKTKNARNLTKTGYAITRDGVLIGGTDIRVSDSEPHHRSPILGFWLGEDYWGQGYMSESARGFLAHVFNAGVGDVICSGASADNAASLRVQEKLGFVREGETMMFAKPRGGEFPHINTVLTRASFKATAA